MGLTNFPNGVSSFGTPITASGYPIGQGNGTAYFCDPANGLDSNDGLSPTSAFDTLSRAHTVMTAGQGDTVYLYSTGQSSGTARQTATLTWSKDNTHIVGVCAPTHISQRARIAPNASGATVFTPFMTVSADGFSMRNVQVFVGFATGGASGGVNVTGDRNYFENVHFAGMGDQTSADHNDSYSLALTGGGENLFRHCTIGIDTVAHDSTGGELLVDGSARRNAFEDCTFNTQSDAADHAMVKLADSSAVDRYLIFDRCKFINFWVNFADNMDTCFELPAGTAYRIYLKDCTAFGIDDWDDNDRAVCFIDGAPPTGNVSGLALVTAST
jgi:hypothetical protein